MELKSGPVGRAGLRGLLGRIAFAFSVLVVVSPAIHRIVERKLARLERPFDHLVQRVNPRRCEGGSVRPRRT